MVRVGIFTGHSGGHLFPAAAFVECFREKFPQSWIGLVTSRKAEPLVSKLPAGLFDRVDYFPEFPFALKFHWRSLQYLFQFLQSFWLAFSYLKKNNVGLCAGFGSYISYPGVVTARLLKIPTLIHEQNWVPGKATRMLVKYADVVAVSFDDTFEKSGLKGRLVTGLPLRSQLIRAAKDVQRHDLFRILVAGGSQGAHRINEVILESFSRLLPEEKKNVAVTHLTGMEDSGWVSKKYAELEIQAEVFPFCETMERLYAKADMAITRAGANTLFELALFRIPAIVIPYPHAEAHQHANAEYFARRSAVLLQEEGTLTAGELSGQILKLKNNSEELRGLSRAMEGISHSDAGSKLADAAVSLLERKSDACH